MIKFLVIFRKRTQYIVPRTMIPASEMLRKNHRFRQESSGYRKIVELTGHFPLERTGI
jgi:hypothetical protein